jgi:hypothetical protein
MNVIIFAGPTISTDEIGAVIDATCLPPVAQGDVYRAAQTHPQAIGLIDGYFEGVPSVWHKEILWAMSRGIHVFGSASMGALRAAELHDFGMRGVGEIFAAYRDGTLEDDDEVAVLHGPAEAGFAVLSEPMVNIRATLDAATATGTISAETSEALKDIAKSLIYKERDWDVLLQSGRSQGLSATALDALSSWLPQGRVDLKRRDATAMLGDMRRLLQSEATPNHVTYDFEWTDMWDKLTAHWLNNDTGPNLPQQLERGHVLDELRLEGERFRQARQQALLRYLALREAHRQGTRPHPQEHRDKISDHRAAQGLYRRAELEAWLTRNHMDLDQFENLMAEEVLATAAIDAVGGALEEHMLARLKLSGGYPALVERARLKQETLDKIGLSHPEPADTGLAPVQLVAWYFGQVLREPEPRDLDKFLQNLGLSSRTDFYRILAREHIYSIRR